MDGNRSAASGKPNRWITSRTGKRISEVYDLAPLGSQIVSFPESQSTDLEKMGAGFRAKRGRVLMRESVNVSAAGGPSPNSDWSPSGLSPDLSKSMAGESLEGARNAILAVYGVLPCLVNPNTAGPAIREAPRHLCQFILQPICGLIAAEASEKLDSEITVDVLQPLSAFDLGQRSRSMSAIVESLARAKEAGINMADVTPLVNWDT